MTRLCRPACLAVLLLTPPIGCWPGGGGSPDAGDTDADTDTGTDTNTGTGEPVDELCNGIDDDDDGETDEDVVDCEGHDGCHLGYCVWFCEDEATEWGSDDLCPPDRVCLRVAGEWVCVRDVCNPETDVALPCAGNPWWCDPGYTPPCRCDAFLEVCVDACFGFFCPAGYVCMPQNGICYQEGCNCYVSGCPDGSRCVDHECVDDPCAGLSCNPGEYCNGTGQCVSPCHPGECPIGCFEGQCTDDPCDGVLCTGYNDSCVDGVCDQVIGPCWNKYCDFWEVCIDGDCVDDPCWTVGCPNGTYCVNGGCYEVQPT